jgi:hypothetical protein
MNTAAPFTNDRRRKGRHGIVYERLDDVYAARPT